MSDRSFLESWSLNFDDIAFIEGSDLVSRVWVAFRLRFLRTHGRFPSREDDPCPVILRHPGVRRASDRDCSAVRAWLVEDCRRSCGRDRGSGRRTVRIRLASCTLDFCKSPAMASQVASGFHGEAAKRRVQAFSRGVRLNTLGNRAVRGTGR